MHPTAELKPVKRREMKALAQVLAPTCLKSLKGFLCVGDRPGLLAPLERVKILYRLRHHECAFFRTFHKALMFTIGQDH